MVLGADDRDPTVRYRPEEGRSVASGGASPVARADRDCDSATALVAQAPQSRRARVCGERAGDGRGSADEPVRRDSVRAFDLECADAEALAKCSDARVVDRVHWVAAAR